MWEVSQPVHAREPELPQRSETVVSIPRRLVQQVIDRDGGWCLLTGPHCLGEATVADHRVNRGMGGSKALNVPENLIAACTVCNGWKETAYQLELNALIASGLRIHRAATVEATLQRCRETPVQGLDGEWWFLLPDGTRKEAILDE